MYFSRFTKLVLQLSCSCLAILALLLYLDQLEASQNDTLMSKSDVLYTEETLVRGALSCFYPDEEFERSASDDFAQTANISPELSGKANYWSVEYHMDYKAVFVNLGLNGNANSVDVYDQAVSRKEDVIANASPDTRRCISIWLVSPYGRYDVVWFDPDKHVGNSQLKDGFAMHLNPEPEK